LQISSFDPGPAAADPPFRGRCVIDTAVIRF